MRSQSVHQFMCKDVREERLKADVFQSFSAQSVFCNWKQYLLKFCLLHIFQHYSLTAFLLDDFVVVWKVVGSGLDAMCRVTCVEYFIYDAYSCTSTKLWISILWIQRKIILDILQM